MISVSQSASLNISEEKTTKTHRKLIPKQQKPAQPQAVEYYISFFYHLTVVYVLFCSLKRGLTRKMCMLCFVIRNGMLCVWITVSELDS